MPTPKIVALVRACKECPQDRYYSGGVHKCELADQIIPDRTEIAPFCPLTDYPSARIAGMDQTIRLLREPNKYALVHAVLSHIATKLGATLTERGMSITIYPTVRREKEVPIHLRLDHLQSVSLSPGAEVRFIDDGTTFKLYPDASLPRLYELVAGEGSVDELWSEIKL